MADLWKNNNRNWFDENRKRYDEHVRLPLKAMAETLSEPVSGILSDFFGKPKVSRINNDIRFSPNKPLYKEHMWVSFRDRNQRYADIFAAIGRKGWAVGCGIGAPKRDPLDEWRRNLIEYTDIWNSYVKASGIGEMIEKYIEKSYKKPLFPDIPDEVRDLVQAKGIWLVEVSRKSFNKNPEADFFRGICRMLPIYFFMVCSTTELLARLKELGKSIKPPDEETGEMWKAMGM